MQRTYAAAKQQEKPVVYNAIELEEINKKSLLDTFENRKNFDKLEDDCKFFEKEKHLMIQHVLLEDQYRQVSHNNLNQSFTIGDKHLLNNFKSGANKVQKQEFIQQTDIVDPSVHEEMTKRSIAEVYNSRADKISALKNFMVL